MWSTFALALVVGALIVSRFRLHKRQSRQLDRLREGAEAFARGAWDERVSAIGPPSIARVAEAMNRMAGQLDARYRAVVRQRNELEAVLSSMDEGVVAVDADERIMTFNAAAGQLLGLDPRFAIGRSIQEVVRNPTMHRLVGEALHGRAPVEGEVILRVASAPAPPRPNAIPGASAPAATPEEPERYLQVAGTVLHDASDERIGALLVFNDVTRLRRLENVRRDFVANVSHEMRTPITAVKASVETLLDGQWHDAEDTERFLRIIQRHADRLYAIVEDLLSLARIEQAEEVHVEMTLGALDAVLAAAAEACQVRAEEKSTTVRIHCDPGLRVRMNRLLLEQAVVNLLDNAIKYGPKSGVVNVRAERANGEVVVSVQDRGEGIEPEHLARIFERFYRVDKGRSRKLGGTGLGLAIVKHICQAHGGRVGVESRPGYGSTFRIHLPVAALPRAG